MATYLFCVERVEVDNPRARGLHSNSDWLSLYLKINDQVLSAGPFNIGPNIHAGDVLTGPWVIGPYQISDTDNVNLSYLVINLGHLDDMNAQRGVAIQAETAFVGAMLGVAGPIGAAIGGIIAGIGQIVGWAVGQDKSNPNCNGEVLHDSFDYPPGTLARLGMPHVVTNPYTVSVPEECGNPPQTKVTYAVINAASIKQQMMMHGFDPGKGVLEFMRKVKPDVSSVEVLLGL